MGSRTDRIGRVIRVHIGAEALVQLGAPVDRARSGAGDDAGDALKGDGAHIEEHPGDVEKRREEEDGLPPEEKR